MVKNNSFFKFFALALFALTLLVNFPRSLSAQMADPNDAFDDFFSAMEDKADADKSANQLMLEAEMLISQKRLLDGRTKLLKALQKYPKEYRIHMMLAEYYSSNVGHFRLALKYIKEAQRLFLDQFGPPPYGTQEARTTHAQLLYLLSQARLDLDNYAGALEVLDEFTSYHYYGSWYPGSRAWVLMKLGRLDEAIKTARMGILTQAEPGRTLNMLGILLSMTGDRSQALQVFKQAVNYELNLGELGQPATPLNNAGEVHKEIYADAEAENSFLKATRMPDGCQHVLPSLNVAMLYMDQLNFQQAKQAIDGFESCVAQFPLRNGEEHRALVELARGRIALGTGHPEEAVSKLESALEHTQWFGKIGTNEDDLKVAATMSLALALEARNNYKRFRALSWSEWFSSLKERSATRIKAWWLKRRARQILMNDLSWIEDLNVRNTDSLIEYPLLSKFLEDFPARVINKRIGIEAKADLRPESKAYYKAYQAAALLKGGSRSEGMNALDDALNLARPRLDGELVLTLQILKLKYATLSKQEFDEICSEVYALSRAALRNDGIALPVKYSGGDSEVAKWLNSAGFLLDGDHTNFEVKATRSSGQLVLEFISADVGSTIKVTGPESKELFNKFADEVFSQQLK